MVGRYALQHGKAEFVRLAVGEGDYTNGYEMSRGAGLRLSLRPRLADKLWAETIIDAAILYWKQTSLPCFDGLPIPLSVVLGELQSPARGILSLQLMIPRSARRSINSDRSKFGISIFLAVGMTFRVFGMLKQVQWSASTSMK